MRPADMVLTGGRVHTLDAAGRVAEALAVVAGRVARVGTAADVESLAGPDTEIVDLAGRSVLPGINDSHLHGVWLGAMWPNLLMDQLTGGGGGPVRLETREDVRAAILRTGKLLASLGITSYTEPGLGPGEDEGETGCFGTVALQEYAGLAASGDLKARVTALMLFGELDGPSTRAGLERGLHDFRPPADVPGWFRVAGVKIFADGIPPMGTAWTARTYASGGHGELLIDDDEPETALRAMITAAHKAGHQVGVHATGDMTTLHVTETFAGLGGDARHYIIHGDLLSTSTLNAMAAAGIGFNTQPGIAAATSSMLADALGPEALDDAWRTRDALDAGVRLSLSSDAPVLTPDWRVGVAAAVARADQPLTLTEALRAYTSTPAWQDGAETWKGTLEEGKVADLCVLDGDLTDLPAVPVAMTVVDGRVVHRA